MRMKVRGEQHHNSPLTNIVGGAACQACPPYCKLTPSNRVFMCSCIQYFSARGYPSNLMYACECMPSHISHLGWERKNSLAFVHLPWPLFPAPPHPASPRISWWSPHSAYSLSSVCLSLSLTALPPQRLGCLDRKALRQLPTITSRP